MGKGIDYKALIRRPVLYGDMVFVLDGYGKQVKAYKALELAKEFLSMSNDSFYSIYDFNWVPPTEWLDRARAQLK